MVLIIDVTEQHYSIQWDSCRPTASMDFFLRAAFKFGRGVHFALRRKNAKTADFSCTSGFKWTNKSPKLKDGQHLRRYSQVTIDTAMNDFNSGQFKVRIKKMAAQVNFYLYPNAFLSSELFSA